MFNICKQGQPEHKDWMGANLNAMERWVSTKQKLLHSGKPGNLDVKCRDTHN